MIDRVARFEIYFKIANSVRKGSGNFNLTFTPEAVKSSIAREFGIVPDGAACKNHYTEMLMNNFLIAGNYSVKANKDLDKYFNKFQDELRKAGLK